MAWYTPPGGSGSSVGGGSGVTSIGLSFPNTFAVANSPLSSAGTISVTYVNQSANTFLAAPSTGTGGPSFRTIVSGDISSFGELLANKNQPNGYAGLDANGQLVGVFIGRYDTEANINNITLSSGELASTTDTYTVRLGNGAASGGLNISINSPTCVYLPANPSSGINGLNLLAAYLRASGLNPSATNPVQLKLGAGMFDLRNAGVLNLNSPYITIIGEGKGVTTILADTAGGGFINLNADNVTLANMTLTTLTTNNAVINYNAGAGTGIYSATNSSVKFTDIEILQLTAGSATANINMNSAITTLAGTYTRCNTNGYFLSPSSVQGWVVSATFEDCVAGQGANSRCWGGGVGGFTNFNGVLRRCRSVSLSTINLIVSGGLVEYCSFRSGVSNGDCFRAASGVSNNRFYYNTILANGTGYSIGDGTQNGITINAAFNTLKLNSWGTGITNVEATGANSANSGCNVFTSRTTL